MARDDGSGMRCVGSSPTSQKGENRIAMHSQYGKAVYLIGFLGILNHPV